MLTQHNDYEALCALAVSGQLTPDALEKLNEHIQTCVECRHVLSDFRHIAAQVLPEFAAGQIPLKSPAGMTARFIARMHSEGIPLVTKKAAHRARSHNWPRHSTVYTVTALVAATLIVILGLKASAPYRQYGAPSSIEVAAAHSEAARTDAQKADLPRAYLTQQLASLHEQVNQLTGELMSERRALEFAHAERLQAGTRLGELEKSNTELRHDLADRDTQVAQLSAEGAQVKTDLDKLALAKSAGEFQVQADQSELKNLQAKVASLTEELDESQQLSAAANQAKELIVARNLHIIDVHDNENGSKPRPFGRIFYSEGKKLVFYAYDLGDPGKLSSKVSFYVWGEKSGTAGHPRNLGVFQSDNKEDGRWFVTFEDRHVLAQINTVFVTIESKKKVVTGPNGNRILVAFLGDRPNHP